MPDNDTPRDTSQIDESTLTDEERDLVASTRRFDLRRILGSLFVVYGVIVFIVGFFTMDAADMRRTGGIAINFWTGAAMFVLGLLFFLWDRLSPVPASDIVRSQRLQDEQASADAEEGLVAKD